MAELRPAAQAVLNTAARRYAIDGDLQESIAAAIRAAANQVVPPDQETPWGSKIRIRRELLAIAAELEALDD